MASERASNQEKTTDFPVIDVEKSAGDDDSQTQAHLATWRWILTLLALYMGALLYGEYCQQKG